MEASARQALIDAARRWFDAGFAVVPTHEDGSKRPFGKWKAYQRERLPWEQLEALLRDGPHTGIGIITGAVSGGAELTELEGPSAVARESLAKIRDLATERGFLDALDAIIEAFAGLSPSGGVHLITRSPDVPGNTRLAANASGKTLAETRGEGGFVVVAPTSGRNGHPDGSAYAIVCGDPSTVPSITAGDRQRLHDVIRDALNATPEPAATTPAGERPARDTIEGLTPWDDYAQRTTWEEILAPHGWQAAYRDAEGRTHWTRPGKNVSDGTSATTRDPGPLYVFTTSTALPSDVGLSKQAAYAHLHHGGDFKAAARALADAGYGDPINRLKAFTPDVDDDLALWIATHLNPINFYDLWDQVDQTEWIAEPLIAARRGTVIYSAAKAGKSLLTLEVCANVATGRPNLGYPAQPPRHVLYVDFENDPLGDIRPRLQAMGFAPADLDEHLHILSFPNIAAFDTDRGSRELLAAAIHYKSDLVVIDTTSRAIEGEENSNDTWLAWYRHTGLKLKQRGIAYVRLDHTGKDASKGQRGGSAKSADVDSIWFLKQVTDTRVELTCDASRFPIAEKHLALRRETSPLRHVATIDTYKDKITELYEQMEAKGVPKIADLTYRQMVAAMKNAGISFDKNLVTSHFITTYAQRITAFQPGLHYPPEGPE